MIHLFSNLAKKGGKLSMSKTIKREIIDDIALIRLNRPSVYNAINMDLAIDLTENLIDISNNSDISGVIITGEGKAFCSGGDLRWISEQGNDYFATFYKVVAQFNRAILEIHRMEKPVFAAVNGLAAGGGFSLALACDFRVMESNAQFILAYTSRGLSIDGGGTYSLPRIIGIAKALEIIAFDEPIGPKDAIRLGLVTEVVSEGNAIHRSLELIHKINEKVPSYSYGLCKRLMYKSFEIPLEFQLEEERYSISWAASQPKGKEGIMAFLEKRQPVYKKD